MGVVFSLIPSLATSVATIYAANKTSDALLQSSAIFQDTVRSSTSEISRCLYEINATGQNATRALQEGTRRLAETLNDFGAIHMNRFATVLGNALTQSAIELSGAVNNHADAVILLADELRRGREEMVAISDKWLTLGWTIAVIVVLFFLQDSGITSPQYLEFIQNHYFDIFITFAITVAFGMIYRLYLFSNLRNQLVELRLERLNSLILSRYQQYQQQQIGTVRFQNIAAAPHNEVTEAVISTRFPRPFANDPVITLSIIDLNITNNRIETPNLLYCVYPENVSRDSFNAVFRTRNGTRVDWATVYWTAVGSLE